MSNYIFHLIKDDFYEDSLMLVEDIKEKLEEDIEEKLEEDIEEKLEKLELINKQLDYYIKSCYNLDTYVDIITRR